MKASAARSATDRPVAVMHLLESPEGHLANLSTTPETATAAEVFAHSISGPIVQSKCVLCHVDGGIAGTTRLRFARTATPGHEAHNLGMFEGLIEAEVDGANVILTKVQGVGHGGGVQLAAGTPAYADLERFLALLGEVEAAPPTPNPPPVTPRRCSTRYGWPPPERPCAGRATLPVQQHRGLRVLRLSGKIAFRDTRSGATAGVGVPDHGWLSRQRRHPAGFTSHFLLQLPALPFVKQDDQSRIVGSKAARCTRNMHR